VASQIWALEEDGWTEIGRLSEGRAELGAASGAVGHVIFVGGRTADQPSSSIAASDLVEGPVIRRISELPTARSGVSAFGSPDWGVCAVGGSTAQEVSTKVECVNVDGAVTSLADLAEPRHRGGSAYAGGLAFALLGSPTLDVETSPTVWVLRPSGEPPQTSREP